MPKLKYYSTKQNNYISEVENHNHIKNNITDFAHTHTVLDINNLNPKFMQNSEYLFSRNSIAYYDDMTKVYNNQPRIVKYNNETGILIEEATTNLIVNSSFENDLTNWSDWGTTTSSSISTANFYHGSKSYYVKTSSNNGGKYQAFTVTPNTVYAISVYVKRVSTNIPKAFHIYDPINSKDILIVQANGNINEWVRYTATVTTASNCTTLRIYLGGAFTNGQEIEAYYDAVQVEAKYYATSYTDSTRANDSVKLLKNKDVRNVFASNSKWTIDLKFKTLAPYIKEKAQTLFSCTEIGGFSFGHVANGNLTYSVRNGSSYVTVDVGNNIFDDGGFHYVTLTCDPINKIAKVFVDGQLKGTLTNFDYGYNTQDNSLFIGVENDNGKASVNEYWNSIFSYVRISNTIISDDDIIKSHNIGTFVPNNNTVYLWTFNVDNVRNDTVISTNATSAFTSSTTNSSYTELQQAQIIIPKDNAYTFEIILDSYVSSGTGKVKVIVDTTTINEITLTNTTPTTYVFQKDIELKANKYTISIQALNQNSATTYIKNCTVRVL